MNIFNDDIKRLNLEDYIWIVFALLAFFNILGDNYLKKFLYTNNKTYKSKADEIFLFILVVSVIIYIYFFYRNYLYFLSSNDNDKELLLVKLIGSSLILAGSLCILYFQFKQSDFIGTPAI